MSFINDLAFGEKSDELEIEGDLKLGGDILLQGAFPKMDQKIFDLNTTIGYKAHIIISPMWMKWKLHSTRKPIKPTSTPL